MNPRILNLPNCITIGRMAVLPLIVVVMMALNDQATGRALLANQMLSLFSALLVCAAMISDVIDGYLARKYGVISAFGQLIDPLADKLLFLTAMIMMIPLGRLPAWIVVIFLSRELTVTSLRAIAVERGIVIAASKLGKYKSAFISSAIVGLLIHYPFFGVKWRLIAWVLMLPSLVLSIASGVDYVWGFIRQTKTK
ncbi:MAG: CDP-diacylglycerol--glycerol-3-phosphate 3-phosphatidyltransferase [Deltaproteobacteria bacterium]|nr:CDP-diacylglycerol--glycerol-3-phosphate 3-phosphatidyltransferase [Deltaproteobacteria bacterium]